METFCLVDSGKGMPRWSVMRESREGVLVWVDFKGRTVAFEDGRVVAHTSGANFHAAMDEMPEEKASVEKAFAYRHLLDPWSAQGWLSPDGKLWGCAFFAHDDIAYALIRKHPARLEHEGWIRVHESSFSVGRDYGRNMTTRQRATLEKLGFVETEAPGWKDPRFPGIDRTAPPPRYAVRPPEDLVLPEPATVASARKEPRPTPDAALKRLVSRLSGYPLLQSLLDVEHELVPDVGPGTWDWMIRWDGLDIGSEEDPVELLRSEGFHIRRTSFDTLEISSWHTPGVHADTVEMRMIESLVNVQDSGVSRSCRAS